MAKKDRPATQLTPLEKAQSLILDGVRPLKRGSQLLSETLGLVLADNVCADMDMPPFDRVTVDGYAVMAVDVQNATDRSPVELVVIEEVAAGTVPKKTVERGFASKVMTGAPMPVGANAMVMVEYSHRTAGSSTASEKVQIFKSVSSGQNVRPQAEDMKKGAVVLAAGTVIRSAEAGILASVGVTRPTVFRRPEVAIIATGNEVITPDQVPKPGEIRDSNGPQLAAQTKNAGAIPVELGIASDTIESLKPLIAKGLESDVLVISGGVSMGDYDIVEDLLAEFGFEMIFDRVNIKPGKPAVFGMCGKTYVFGLPGNPVSGLVTFAVLVRPLLRALMGYADWFPQTYRAELQTEMLLRDPRRTFHPVRVEREGSKLLAFPVEHHSSADLRSIADAHALLVTPESTTVMRRNDEYDLYMLDDF